MVCNQCKIEVNKCNEFKQKVIRSLKIGRWLTEQNTVKLKDPLSEDIKLEPSEAANNEFETIIVNSKADVSPEWSDKSPVNEIKVEPEIDMQESGNSENTTTNNKSEFICKTCNESFPKKRTLISHRRRLHNNSKLLKCPECDKTFPRIELYNSHVKRHYGIRNHKCELCGRGFYTKYNLTEHVRIHTGERPFKCEQCEKTFTRSVLLKNHIKRVI